MLLTAVFLAALPTQCPDPAVPSAGFPIEESVDLTITLSDGETTTAVARWPRDPSGPCGWPLLVFTHGLNGSRTSVVNAAREYTELGYVTVAYDVRGHDTATGLHTFWGQRERFDLAEVIEWAQASFPALVDPQRVGLSAISQGAVISLSLAAFSGEAFEPNPWRTGFYPQIDAIAVENLTPGFAPVFAPGGVGVHTNIGTSLLTMGEVRYAPSVTAALTTSVLSGDFAPWAALANDPTREVGPRASGITTAVFAMGCWDDFWFPASELIARMSQIPATTPKKLYVGAVGHSAPANVEQRNRRALWRRQWLDRHLKGELNGIDEGPWFTYAATPADAATYLDVNSLWTHAATDQWPLPDRHEYPLFLAQNSALEPTAPKFAEPADRLSQKVLPGFDGAALLNSAFRLVNIEPGIPRAALTFESQPLPSALEFAGAPRARLFLTSFAANWQIAASLWDVDELGNERYVSSGSYFASAHAGGTLEASIALEPNVYAFAAGHRVLLRLENMHVHEPPVGELLRYAPTVAPFNVDVEHSPGVLSALYLPVDAGAPVGFGWSQTNSEGCQPVVTATGVPSLASSAPFTIDAANTLNNKDGVFLYAFGRKRKPIGGGLLWLAGPLVRTGRVDSAGNPPPDDDCSGSYSFDFGARMRSGLHPSLTAGVRIYGQYWSRDSAAPGGTNLSHGIEFTILP